MAPELSGVVAPYKRMVYYLNLPSGFARRGTGHYLGRCSLAVICAGALVVARADAPRRRWGGRIVLNKLGEVAGGQAAVWLRLAAPDLDCASRRKNPRVGDGATYALTERQLSVAVAVYAPSLH